MKNNLFCVIALLFLLPGCVPNILYRPDVTQDERKKDSSTEARLIENIDLSKKKRMN